MGSTDEGICSKESASLENDNTTDSKSEDSGRQVTSKVLNFSLFNEYKMNYFKVQSKVLTDQRKKRK